MKPCGETGSLVATALRRHRPRHQERRRETCLAAGLSRLGTGPARSESNWRDPLLDFANRLCPALLSPRLGLAGSAFVAFRDAEHYTDIARYGDQREAAAIKARLARHIEWLAQKELAADQTLAVEVLDVDLAGHLEPWRFGFHDIRILRQVTWPRITLRYSLSESGRILLQSGETVSDVNYLDRTGYYFASDVLRYEKRMLDDWFRARFVERRPPR